MLGREEGMPEGRDVGYTEGRWVGRRDLSTPGSRGAEEVGTLELGTTVG